MNEYTVFLVHVTCTQLLKLGYNMDKEVVTIYWLDT